MLERHGLLLRPWHSTMPADAPKSAKIEPRPTFAREILDADSREQLGTVRQTLVSPWQLLPWLRRRVLEVLESADESLLCTLHGPALFWQPWRIEDAEESLVATLRGAILLDEAGQFFAYEQTNPRSRRKSYLDRHQNELAMIETVADGIVLRFDAVTEKNPFLRMAILGATLAGGTISTR
jgi:hypothetical protein